MPEPPLRDIGDQFKEPQQIRLSGPVGADEKVEFPRLPSDVVERTVIPDFQLLNCHRFSLRSETGRSARSPIGLEG